jgi:hypothetical protein
MKTFHQVDPAMKKFRFLVLLFGMFGLVHEISAAEPVDSDVKL